MAKGVEVEIVDALGGLELLPECSDLVGHLKLTAPGTVLLAGAGQLVQGLLQSHRQAWWWIIGKGCAGEGDEGVTVDLRPHVGQTEHEIDARLLIALVFSRQAEQEIHAWHEPVLHDERHGPKHVVHRMTSIHAIKHGLAAGLCADDEFLVCR